MARASVVPAAGGSHALVEARSDFLFSALDGQTVYGHDERWVVQVTGIHRRGQDTFVQVTSADAADCGVVLRMPAQATAAHALAALAAHLDLPPGERPHVVDVMRVVGAEVRQPLRVC
jgi:hypothetical protein